MFDKFIFSTKKIIGNVDLRAKILYTLFIIAIYRFLASIPLPGVDFDIFSSAFSENTFAMLAQFSTGGNMLPTIAGLGLSAYITTSIMMQLLQVVIPKLEELSKEGQRGRMIINQITRYITLPMSLIQGFILYYTSRGFGYIKTDLVGVELFVFIIALLAGTMLVMWLAEEITEHGVGQGSTWFIIATIVNALPGVISKEFSDFISIGKPELVIFMTAGIVAIIAFAVFANESVRKIKIQYASRGNNQLTQGGNYNEQSFFPVKLNFAGVMPVIFASYILGFPRYIIQALTTGINPIVNSGRKLYDIFKWLENNLYSLSTMNSFYLYIGIELVLIFLFTIFYSIVQFKPQEVSENLSKSGAFIPGIRPGNSTTKFLSTVVLRVGFIGAIFLSIIAVIPNLSRFISISVNQQSVLGILGGTSILILVSGLIETSRQLNAQAVGKSYDRFSVQ